MEDEARRSTELMAAVSLAPAPAQPMPWWRRGAIVTTLTAIIAAVLPVTTAVQAHFQKERELALQESKQAHEIRTSYLDRLDKPGARLRTLRFVLATTDDRALRTWAEAEIGIVKVELADLDKEIVALNIQLTPEQRQERLNDLWRRRANGAAVGPDDMVDDRGRASTAQPTVHEDAKARMRDDILGITQTDLDRLKRARSTSKPTPDLSQK